MAELFGTNLHQNDLSGFCKTQVDGQVYYVAGCVAYTPEQLGVAPDKARLAPSALLIGSLKPKKLNKSSRPMGVKKLRPLFPPGPMQARSATKNTGRWPSGIVYYRYKTTFTATEQAMFKQACAMWEVAGGRNAQRRKVVQFVHDASNRMSLHLRVQRGTIRANEASTGAVSAPYMKIGFWDKGSIAHELGHVLGLVHEHQRHDRDDFVQVAPQVAGNPNFRRHAAAEDTIRTDYDFGSLMHYARNVVLNGQTVPALIPRSGFESQALSMGQRLRPSPHDVKASREVYA